MTEQILTGHRKFWGPMQELLHRAKELIKTSGASSEKITERLVRYYMTRGIIDKPDRLGREAAFSLRHLLQLSIAVRLTQQSVPLEMIANFSGVATDRMLEKWFGMRSEVLALRVKEHALNKRNADEALNETSPENAPASHNTLDLQLIKELRRDLMRWSTTQQVTLADQANHVSDLRSQIRDLGKYLHADRGAYFDMQKRLDLFVNDVQGRVNDTFMTFDTKNRMYFDQQQRALEMLREELGAMRMAHQHLTDTVSELLHRLNEKKD